MEKINIYREKLIKEDKINLKQDLIVPDSKQDIFQIKDSSFYSYLSKVEVSNGMIKANGNIDSYISYISSGEETVGLKTVFIFESIINDSLIQDSMGVKYDIVVQKEDIKIVNERKISISLDLKIIYYIYGIDEVELFDDFSEIDDIQINSKAINISSLTSSNFNIANLKEEIKIDNTDIVSDILSINTEIFNKEVKISHRKVLTKADLLVSIKYLTQDNRICDVEEKFSIMSFIDMENINENNICTTDYQVRDIELNINNSDENSIILQMEYEINCNAFEEKERNIIIDIYSLKYDLEFSSRSIQINDESEEKGEVINIVQNITKKEIANQENYSMMVYSIKKNDTIWDIAKKFKVIKENIINSNGLEEPYNLKTGDKMYIVR